MSKHLIELIRELNDVPRPVGRMRVCVRLGDTSLDISQIDIVRDQVFIRVAHPTLVAYGDGQTPAGGQNDGTDPGA